MVALLTTRDLHNRLVSSTEENMGRRERGEREGGGGRGMGEGGGKGC